MLGGDTGGDNPLSQVAGHPGISRALHVTQFKEECSLNILGRGAKCPKSMDDFNLCSYYKYMNINLLTSHVSYIIFPSEIRSSLLFGNQDTAPWCGVTGEATRSADHGMRISRSRMRMMRCQEMSGKGRSVLTMSLVSPVHLAPLISLSQETGMQIVVQQEG